MSAWTPESRPARWSGCWPPSRRPAHRDARSSSASATWSATFDAMNDAVSLLDLEGTVVRCNSAMAALVGRDTGEVIGARCHELVHGSDALRRGVPVPEDAAQREAREPRAVAGRPLAPGDRRPALRRRRRDRRRRPRRARHHGAQARGRSARRRDRESRAHERVRSRARIPALRQSRSAATWPTGCGSSPAPSGSRSAPTTASAGRSSSKNCSSSPAASRRSPRHWRTACAVCARLWTTTRYAGIIAHTVDPAHALRDHVRSHPRRRRRDRPEAARAGPVHRSRVRRRGRALRYLGDRLQGRAARSAARRCSSRSPA